VAGRSTFDDDTPLYVISVAAEISGLHPQTLRQYDRLGLVRPGRATGRGRRYSMRDIHQLREVQRLSQEEGINLAGIKRILELEREVAELRDHLFHLRNELQAARNAVARRGATHSHPGSEILPLRHARITIFETGDPSE
jgi:MerR family transcriptional regulator, heat shock protein HspR